MTEWILGLRTIKQDRTSYGGFKWPDFTGEPVRVEAPDFDPKPRCGGGIHFLPWGVGDTALLGDVDDIWQVVRVDAALAIDIDGAKSKAPWVEIIFEGRRSDATNYIAASASAGVAVPFICRTAGHRSTLTGGHRSTLTGGDGSTLTGGDHSTLTGGDDSTLTGGHRSTLTGGDGSTLTGGHRSTLTGGDYSTLTGGDRSTLTGGHRSTLTGGDGSTLTGGDDSTLTGGDYSTLTGGDHSTLTGGHRSTLTGGDHSTLIFKWWDNRVGRVRIVIAYPGEDGIEVDKPYRLDDDHKLVEVAA